MTMSTTPATIQCTNEVSVPPVGAEASSKQYQPGPGFVGFIARVIGVTLLGICGLAIAVALYSTVYSGRRG